MKATKHKLMIEIEVLSLNVVSSLLSEIHDLWLNENTSGSLVKTDGDCVKWAVLTEEVSF